MSTTALWFVGEMTSNGGLWPGKSEAAAEDAMLGDGQCFSLQHIRYHTAERIEMFKNI